MAEESRGKKRLSAPPPLTLTVPSASASASASPEIRENGNSMDGGRGQGSTMLSGAGVANNPDDSATQRRNSRRLSRNESWDATKSLNSNNAIYGENVKPAVVKSSTSPSLTNVPKRTGSGARYHQEETSPDTPIDPLSQQILRRTTSEKPNISKLRSPASAEPEGGSDFQDSPPIVRGESNISQKTVKDKKKGVSFLSRIIGGKKKDSDANDNASELDDSRATGMDAEVFAQPIGFFPKYPPPPRYIRVRSHYKREKEFNRLFVAQELSRRTQQDHAADDKSQAVNVVDDPDVQPKTGKATWAVQFSKDGKFVAAAGQDRKVRVWSVIATKADRQAHEIEEEAQNDQPFIRLSAPVFKSQPIQEFEGHTASIVDLSWSKNNFLLSTSMDKTVRLWHVTRNECLCCFRHNDFVTSIQFHPRDDRFFLAGSLDCKLRLWSIPDKSVAFWVTVPDMITAVAFTPDGKHSIAGCLNGLCLIYDTDGLKLQSQLHVRSARGRNAKGSKITGIDTIVQPPDNPNGSVKLLITSNDSRIRLYNFRDRTLEIKFRGNENNSSQIRASFSSDGRYVICGSEDRRVYIWSTTSAERDPDKRGVEIFEAHSSIVTTAIMAPTTTKRILGSTGDLLYDLCNPPPVKLGDTAASTTSKQTAEHANAGPGDSVRPTPQSSGLTDNQKLEESPSYIARSSHPGGNIIITADYNGTIKVFRQDCGYHKRRHEATDSNLTFSRKLLGRTNSVSTRRSVASSFSKDSLYKTPSDRILSWRNSVFRSDNPSTENIRASQGTRTRSVSPSKASSVDYDPKRFDTPHVAITPADEPTTKPGSPPSPKEPSEGYNPFSGIVNTKNGSVAGPSKSSAPIGDDTDNPLWLQGGQSYAFWNKSLFSAQANRPQHLDPDDAYVLGRRESLVSKLSSDESSADHEEGEELTCSRCAGSNFRATRTKHGEQRLICVNCGYPAP